MAKTIVDMRQMKKRVRGGLQLLILDLHQTCSQIPLALFLGWNSIKRRYRRTYLGPIWLTIERLIFSIAIIFLAAALFGGEPKDRAAHVMIGLTTYTYFTESILVGMKACVLDQNLKFAQIAIGTRILRHQFEVALQFIHDLLMVVPFLILFGIMNWFSLLLAFVCASILAITCFEIAVILSPIHARFRDVGPLVVSLFRLGFFATPVVWKIEDLQADKGSITRMLVTHNPANWAIEIIRVPIVDERVALNSLQVLLMMSVFALPLALAAHWIAVKKIGYWV